MDNFKAFQLSSEEAMNVTGQGHKGKKKGHQSGLGRLLHGFSKEDRTAIKTAIKGLKAADGWEDLDKEGRTAKINAVIEPYKV